MTLDYLSVVCGWNLKQMVISFPLGTIQLLRFIYFFFLFPYCLLLFLLSLLSVCVEVAEHSHSRATGLSQMPVGTCGFAGSGSSQALSVSSGSVTLSACEIPRPPSFMHREQLPHECSWFCIQWFVVSVSWPDTDIFQSSDDHIWGLLHQPDMHLLLNYALYFI